MLYVAIDQHAKQITVAIRNDQGEDVLKCQVSSRREKIEQFFNQVVAMDPESIYRVRPDSREAFQ